MSGVPSEPPESTQITEEAYLLEFETAFGLNPKEIRVLLDRTKWVNVYNRGGELHRRLTPPLVVTPNAAYLRKLRWIARHFGFDLFIGNGGVHLGEEVIGRV